MTDKPDGKNRGPGRPHGVSDRGGDAPVVAASDEAGLPLSLLVDRLAGDGPRNEAFVRRLCAWLHERADRLALDAVEALGLVDVVLTFRMKGDVTLVATGRRPDLPGEVTVRWREGDFPFLRLAARRTPRPDPYQVCTLDHSLEGRRVTVGGRPGTVRVLATVGGVPRLQVLLDGDERPIEVDAGAVSADAAGDAV